MAVLGPVQVVDARGTARPWRRPLGDRDRLVLLLELVVEVRDELLLHPGVHPLGRLAGRHLRSEPREPDVQLRGLLGSARDDQRRAGLVDQDVVDLVDDRERVVVGLALLGLGPAAVLDLLVERRGHVVAQVVEAELGVRPVGHVGGVGGALVLVGLHVLEHADAHAERVVDRLHPHRVAAGQVVVDGHDVDAAAAERVEHDGQRRGQRLALAGPHLGDRAVVQHHAADQLHVEVAHAHRALARLAHEREAFVQQVLEALAAGGALAQLVGGLSQLGVGVVLQLGLESIDPSNPLFVDLELLRFAHAKRAVQNGHRASVAVGR